MTAPVSEASMRFVMLIFSLLFSLNLHALENWGWVRFDDTDAGALAPAGGEDADYLPHNPDEPKVINFSIYFLHRNGCFPVINSPSKQRVTGLQLRVDEREVHRPPTIKWEESESVVRAFFIQSTDPSEEQVLEDMQMARSFLRDVSEGKTLRAKLEPSGDVRRWSLLGSKKALDAAMGHCFDSIEAQQYFTE